MVKGGLSCHQSEVALPRGAIVTRVAGNWGLITFLPRQSALTQKVPFDVPMLPPCDIATILSCNSKSRC